MLRLCPNDVIWKQIRCLLGNMTMTFVSHSNRPKHVSTVQVQFSFSYILMFVTIYTWWGCLLMFIPTYIHTFLCVIEI